ncbi:eukaryotic translation initiation factor-like [Forsythia ovata]|uniref:Eukaryotic translation initiation factor-like n=1 Tax=Forsythia ovata TaxID=205694 RepID=A0ABD1WBY1_9LAMI
MPRGDGSTAQPAGRVQPTPFGKSPPLNQRFLPQGSGGFMSGRASALLQGSGVPPPSHPANYGGVGTEPGSQAPAPFRNCTADSCQFLLLDMNVLADLGTRACRAILKIAWEAPQF